MKRRGDWLCYRESRIDRSLESAHSAKALTAEAAMPAFAAFLKRSSSLGPPVLERKYVVTVVPTPVAAIELTER